MILLDSQRMKSPSLIVGTKPLGFIARYSGFLLPPNLPPQSSRSNSRPSSPKHQSTFCTLDESVLPQILIIFAPNGSFSVSRTTYHSFMRLGSILRTRLP